jgi:hypothetical protein
MLQMYTYTLQSQADRKPVGALPPVEATHAPAFEGDVTFIDAEVTDKLVESIWGAPLAKVKLRATNQDGAVLVDAIADVELPI